MMITQSLFLVKLYNIQDTTDVYAVWSVVQLCKWLLWTDCTDWGDMYVAAYILRWPACSFPHQLQQSSDWVLSGVTNGSAL